MAHVRLRGIAGRRDVGIEDDDDELIEYLQARTLESLDFDLVLEALAERCTTVPGKTQALDATRIMQSSPTLAQKMFDAVHEASLMEPCKTGEDGETASGDLVIGSPLDIIELVKHCARGLPMDAEPLHYLADAVEALQRLRFRVEQAAQRGLEIPTLVRMVGAMTLPDQVLEALVGSFEEDGTLSKKKFPQFAKLDERIKRLESDCRRTVQEVLGSGKYARFMSEDGYMQMGSRYVLCVKPEYVGKVGVAVDDSQSGRTVYVEPHEVKDNSRELAGLKKEQKKLTRRVFAAMASAIAKGRKSLLACVDVAVELDLVRARWLLGLDMDGKIPDVNTEGVMVCSYAQNPILALRSVDDVVGHRLELGGGGPRNLPQGLVLTGPNAGGKTVVLKTVGLLAVLARCGVPLPGGRLPRVGFFDVILADVGDMQTIAGDLSTYSAQLLSSRVMLEAARKSGARTLVLLDEAGGGTDPLQGGAVAQALVEELLALGARVVSTTHSSQLKAFAAEHEKLEVAAMAYQDGRPTFRLEYGAIGQAHAIDAARRVGIPKRILQRAEDLLGDQQRALLGLQRKVEEREKELRTLVVEAAELKAEAEEAAAIAKEKALAVEEEERQLQAAQSEFDIESQKLRKRLLREHENRVDVFQRSLEHSMIDLERTAKQQEETRQQIVAKALEQCEEEKGTIFGKEVQLLRERPKGLDPSERVVKGEFVKILKQGQWYGSTGKVLSVVGLGGGEARVRVSFERSGTKLDFRKSELTRATGKGNETQVKRNLGALMMSSRGR